jgi:hypothetical protein
MKISEMTNEQAAEAMIRLSEPFSNICDDEEALNLIDEMGKMKDMPLIKAIAKALPKIVAFGLQKHKADVYEIIGALLMVSTTKVAKMNFAETVKAVRDSYDDMLASFFTQSALAEKVSAKESV